MNKNLFRRLFCLTLLSASISYADSAIPEQPRNEQPASLHPAGLGISSNPGAVNIFTGTGGLGRLMGIKDRYPVRFGGLWVGDGDVILTGGIKHHKKTLSGNDLLILSLTLDTEKMSPWKGGLFGAEFLQFNGMNTNFYAGSVQGYDSLPGPSPLGRSELYQLWYRQSLFHDKLVFRIGKMVPSFDFNNVLRPIPVQDQTLAIPSVSGLLYTPIFVNSSMLGILPGYYNSAYGIVATFSPTNSFYLSAGAYDGNLARGKQTGLRGPHFDGYYLYISEAGYSWQLGAHKMPGFAAIGGWDQTGKLSIPTKTEHGTQGIYAFGSQRLWLRHPGRDNSGISGFFQLGINNSKTLPMNQFVGLGLTAFALTRPLDSMGVGMAWAWLNPRSFNRSSELMFQAYYQAHLFYATYFQPAITYIPTPGASKHLPQTWTGIARIIALF